MLRLEMPYRIPDIVFMDKDSFIPSSPKDFGQKYIGSNIQRKRARKHK